MQFTLHPFPSVAFPSSQVSVPTLNPSPQMGEQVDAGVDDPEVQVHLELIPRQFEEQPMLSSEPSSHDSGVTMIPSPQIV